VLGLPRLTSTERGWLLIRGAKPCPPQLSCGTTSSDDEEEPSVLKKTLLV